LGERSAWKIPDLSSIRFHLQTALEPISVSLCNEFLNTLAYNGFSSATAMYPVYGLAEACLAVTFPRLGADLSLDFASIVTD